MNARTWAVCVFVWAGLPGLSTAIALAAEDADGEWRKACKKIKSGEICLTNARVSEPGGLIASASFIKSPSGSGEVLRVLLPLGMQTVHGSRMLLDGTVTANVVYDRCSKNGCIANFEVGADVVSKIQGGTKLTVQAINTDGKPLNFVFPLTSLSRVRQAAAASWTSLPAARQEQLQQLIYDQGETPAVAPRSQRLTVPYAPWRKACTNPDNPAAKPVCFTGKNAWSATGAASVAVVVIEPSDGGKKLVRITLPYNASLRIPVRFTVDSAFQADAPYVICNANGCIADLDLSPSLLEQLSSGRSLAVKFTQLDGATVSTPIALADFARERASAGIDARLHQTQQQQLLKEVTANFGRGRWKGETGIIDIMAPTVADTRARAVQSTTTIAPAADDMAAIFKRCQAALASNDTASLLREAELYEVAARTRFGVTHATYGTALHLLGLAHQRKRSLDVAEGYYKRALVIREAAPQNTDLAWTWFNLSNVYLDQKKFDLAAALLVRVLDLRERMLGKEHTDTAQALNNLGMVNQRMGKFKEAEEYHKRALAIREKSSGIDQLPVARSLGELGWTYYQQKKYAEAEKAYERTMPMWEARGSKAELAQALFNLSNVYVDQKKYDQAEISLGRVVALREQALGNDHLDTAQALHNLGRISRLLKKYQGAEEFLSRSLAIRQKAPGDNRQAAAYSLYELGMVGYVQKKYPEAEAFYRQGLPLAEQTLRDVALANYVYDVSLVYRPLGNYSEAERLIKLALPIFEQKLGANSERVENASLALAFVVRSQGRLDEALELVRRAYAIKEANLGPDHHEVIAAIAKLGRLYQIDLKYVEAEQLFLRVLAVQEKKLGESHIDLAPQISSLAETYLSDGKVDEAEMQYKRLLAVRELHLEPVDASVSETLLKLAQLYRSQNRIDEAEATETRLAAIRQRALRGNDADAAKILGGLATKYADQLLYGEAEELYRRALAIQETKAGAEEEALATRLGGLGSVLRAQGRYTEAENIYKRSLAIRERLFGGDAPEVANSLTSLALVQSNLDKESEAEDRYKRALSIYDHAVETNENHMAFDYRIVTPLQNLANMYRRQGRYGEAEGLYRKVIAIETQLNGAGYSNVARALNNIGILNRLQGRLEEAEKLERQALAIAETAAGADSPLVGFILNSLAFTNQSRGRYDEAELLYRRALEIAQKRSDGSGLTRAELLNDLAMSYQSQGKYNEALALLNESLAIREEKLGVGHSRVAETLNNLAKASEMVGKADDAIAYSRKSTAALVQHESRGNGSIRRDDPSRVPYRDYFLQHVRGLALATQGGLRSSPAIDDEAFDVSQWATQSAAAAALQQMTARSASGNATLLALARERQDLEETRSALDQQLNDLMSRQATIESRTAAGKLREQIVVVESRRAAITTQFDREFPEYATLASPKPLSSVEAKGLLAADEALVYFLVGEKQSYVFALTNEQFVWKELSSGSAALSEKVKRFRHGLHDFEDQRQELVRSGKRPELFDLSVAHDLYTTLLGPVEDLIKDKRHVMVVPSGSLTALPFHLLVTDKPSVARPEIKDIANYRDAAWLIKRQAVTVLPSVSSLKALRIFAARQQPATKPLIGFGDPVFDPAERTRALAEQRATIKVAAKTRAYSEFWRGAGVDRANLAHSLPSLLDTATELKTVAKKLGAPASDIYLDKNATEINVKDKPLADYKVVYFATHGLVAGDVTGMGEPSLALTLPSEPSALDDGLLTASEVAQLKLNADWVVLSACNTMAGDKPGAEALSGLARAFFYAGARAILVSHWSIDSASATRLTTSTFARMADDPRLSRSEALRRAMIDYMNDTSNPLNAYPAFWAPFSVVGEGAAR